VEFKREYLCEWIGHDENSCNALREYEGNVDHISMSAFKYMVEVANKYETTIAKMKKHRECIENDQTK